MRRKAKRDSSSRRAKFYRGAQDVSHGAKNRYNFSGTKLSFTGADTASKVSRAEPNGLRRSTSQPEKAC